MLNNDACVGQSPLTSEVPKDRVMVISLMVGCRRTRAEMGIVQTEKGSVWLVMLMINYASVERLGQRRRRSWIRDMEHNTHELTWQKMMEQITCRFKPFKEGDKVWLESRYLKLCYENPETRRTVQSPQRSKSPQLPTGTPKILVNSSCHPHHPSISLQREQHPQNQLRNTIPWPYWRWTQVRSWSHNLPQEARKRPHIPYQVERISHWRQYLGTREKPQQCQMTPENL